ncbi:hypothetical protein [Fonticella tunisiensis]|uniref:Tetratricopeptide repeat protein n=1 Tax=Fonticella tunisiensis TaxID=1096341 RepID=A0A4R7KRD9_9CLOT|nr:hypothetical protein [Fonticella tunisiensis]TDT61173.1 hypothetical protein EDD71_10871 [Fonticella tunisiensis]
MSSEVLYKILDALENRHMYDAAIEACRAAGVDETIADYYRILKGENISVDINSIDERYREKLEYILCLKDGKNNDLKLILVEEDAKNKDILDKAFESFNRGRYQDAEKYFKAACKCFHGDKKVFALTYVCLCQYRMEEYVLALKTINEAVDIQPWNDNLKKIREGIIDRLSGIESKNKFIEDYYSRGTIVGEILRHSMELYQKIDNIEIKNKNLFKRITEFIAQARRLFDDEKRVLEQDLENINSYIINGERQLNLYIEDKKAKKFASRIEKYGLPDEVEKVVKVAETLHIKASQESDIDYSHIVFLYSKGIEMLCRHKLIPYFNRHRKDMPVINERSDYNKIGINTFDVGGLIRYKFKNYFDIQCSPYLMEINKNNILRKEFKGKEHVMPWDKLKFISHCIKTGKDPIDGSKSAGMLLLFYGTYNNYLGLEYDNLQINELIVLAGNLIRLQNERNALIHSKILDDREWIDNIRKLCFDCIEKLCNIK